MLHTKFQGNLPSSSGEEDFFLSFRATFEHGGHLGYLTWTISINFSFPFLKRFHMKFDFD